MVVKKIFHKVGKISRRYSFFYPSKNDSSIKWGIIGLGNMAETFATALDKNKDSKIVAVASRSLSKAIVFARNHGKPKPYGSYESLLSDINLDVDVIYIATPAKYHAKHIRECLNAGKHVVCEKPITTNARELEELIHIAQNNKLFLMEGMWMKCLPTFVKAKEWLDNGKIGILELIKIDFYKREIINPSMTIFNAAEDGGVLHDFGVYAIAFMQSYMGGVPDSMIKHARKSFCEVDADWQIYAEKKGVNAFVNMSSNYQGLSKAALIGSKGTIEWDSQFNRTNKITLYDEKGLKCDSYTTHYISDGYEYEINEVNRCLKRGLTQSEKVSLDDSFQTMTIMDSLIFNINNERKRKN